MAQNVGHMCLFTNPCALAWFGLVLLCFGCAFVTFAKSTMQKRIKSTSEWARIILKHMVLLNECFYLRRLAHRSISAPSSVSENRLVNKHMRPTFRATNPGLPFFDYFHGLYNLGPFRLKNGNPGLVARNVGLMWLFTNPCALAWFELILMCFWCAFALCFWQK